MSPEGAIGRVPGGKTKDKSQQKQKTKGKTGDGKGKAKGKQGAIPPETFPGRLTDADGYVVEPPPSNSVDGESRFEAPVLLPANKVDEGKTLAEELDRLRNGGQRDTVLTSTSNGTFPRTSSLSLMEV